MSILPAYDLEKIKFTVDRSTFERAVELYEKGKVTNFQVLIDGFSASVIGTKPYQVLVSARHYDRGDCQCYLGKHNILCKHMVAVAIYAIKRGKPLTQEEKQMMVGPRCSGRVAELNQKEWQAVQEEIAQAMKYIKAYTGPSRTWFDYQDSLSEGCVRLSKLVSRLPVNEQTAQLLVDLLLRLDKKLSQGGVDDSDGTVSGFMEGVVEVLKEYAKLKPSSSKAFQKLARQTTCFGWEEPLVKILKQPR
jgi:hypothetical protein